MTDTRLHEDRSSVRHDGLLRRLSRDKLVMLPLGFLAVLLLFALLAPWIAPSDPNDVNLSERLLSPVWHNGSWSHPLGTDWEGFDILSRLLYGARTSLFVGAMVVLAAGTFGVLYGLCAGRKGGRAERWLMGWVDVQTSFPSFLLAMLMVAFVGGSVTSITVILAINGWTVYARMTYGVVKSADERQPMDAEVTGGVATGVTTTAALKQVLPSVAIALATIVMFEFARTVLAEAALSYLGLGIQHPGVSWGLDVARAQQHELFRDQWLMIYPGILLTVTVFAANLSSSRIRDVVDPRSRQRPPSRSVCLRGPRAASEADTSGG